MDRPILFSGAMVRAILEGRKTQTRRAIKSQPQAGATAPHLGMGAYWVWMLLYDERPDYRFAVNDTVCPYGVPGDRLWVRERHTFEDAEPLVGGQYSMDCIYHADHKRRILYECDAPIETDFLKGVSHWKPRPSIHMPRWASRITLEITDVRVQRLQEISEGDAQAEGAFFTDYGRNCFHGTGVQAFGNCPAPPKTHPQREGWSMVETTSHEQCLGSARFAFGNLWESINAKRGLGWDKNPWVWCLSFRRAA